MQLYSDAQNRSWSCLKPRPRLYLYFCKIKINTKFTRPWLRPRLPVQDQAFATIILKRHATIHNRLLGTSTTNTILFYERTEQDQNHDQEQNYHGFGLFLAKCITMCKQHKRPIAWKCSAHKGPNRSLIIE